MAGVLAVVGVLAGCGTATSARPTPTGPGVLTLKDAAPARAWRRGGLGVGRVRRRHRSVGVEQAERHGKGPRPDRQTRCQQDRQGLDIPGAQGFRVVRRLPRPVRLPGTRRGHRHARAGQGRGQEGRPSQAEVLARRPDGQGARFVREGELDVGHHRHGRRERPAGDEVHQERQFQAAGNQDQERLGGARPGQSGAPRGGPVQGGRRHLEGRRALAVGRCPRCCSGA